MTAQWIGTVLGDLYSNVSSANQIGNVEGLAARHLLSGNSNFHMHWGVDCDDSWMQRTYDPSNLGSVAALAYSLHMRADDAWCSELKGGLQRASTRDWKSAGPGAAMHDPAVLVGLSLGAKRLSADSPQFSAWCANVVRELQSRSAQRMNPMLAYAGELVGLALPTIQPDRGAPLVHRAAIDWWIRRTRAIAIADAPSLGSLRSSVIDELLSTTHAALPAHQAALLWMCVREAVSETAATALQTPGGIAQILRRFPACMKRWRWDPSTLRDPVNWSLASEREVQDVLWMLLRSVAPDLEDEDTLPKFGLSTYKADFGIPSLGLLIEVKFARVAADLKTVEKEVLEDIVPYLRAPERYREVVIFIYDDSCSVQLHDTVINSLKTVAGICDVVIVCRPSQLPAVRDQKR